MTTYDDPNPHTRNVRAKPAKVRFRRRFGRWRLVWDGPTECHFERRYRLRRAS